MDGIWPWELATIPSSEMIAYPKTQSCDQLQFGNSLPIDFATAAFINRSETIE